MERRSELTRSTLETRIKLTLSLDGQGRAEVQTGVGFFDHLLTLWAAHGRFDLKIEAAGDTWVDDHHTIEDVGLTLGAAFGQALGEKRGIRRYGAALLPMDEALVRVVVDLSGRPYLHCNVPFPVPQIGSFATELVAEFLRAYANEGKLTLHVDLLHGENGHHIAEAVFKGLGRALREAVSIDPGVEDIPSTKGTL
ncbi:MAG: imidazoleglycerol-phosphate dehydratase [Bacillota bacterium]|jgi:imidazoleglycerol-phosphate dehydratase|nr:imidazoleglycerol-phosphate dehydratase [Bacillota bacterium]MDK2882695.1 imidazoleglycerol-phosphate dehydratase [Bacillota bacterium]